MKRKTEKKEICKNLRFMESSKLLSKISNNVITKMNNVLIKFVSGSCKRRCNEDPKF